MSLLSMLPEPGSLFAGFISGICAVSFSQPFDIIKVRLQNTGGSDLKVLKEIIKNEGFLSLWRGAGISILGACASNAISFGVVEKCKSVMMQERIHPLTGWEHGMCGVISGLACSFITSPAEGIKIRLQTQKAKSKDYKNAFQCISDIKKHRGMMGLYRGFWVTLIRDVIGDGAYFASYQVCPRLVYNDMENTENRSFLVISISGGLAGIIGWTFVYPLDTIKSRIQADSVTKPQYKGAIDCFFKILKHEKISRLFSGYLNVILRSFPSNMIAILGFEATMKLVGRSYTTFA